jgi:hypothetical protein
MRGSWSPASQSTMRLPPKAVVICTKWLVGDARSPISAARGPADGRASRRAAQFGVERRDDRQQLAFVGDIERIEAEELAGGGDLGFTGIALLEHHADARLAWRSR